MPGRMYRIYCAFYQMRYHVYLTQLSQGQHTKMKWKFAFVSLVFIMALSLNARAESPASLWPVVDMLQSKEFVDLTHAFHPGIPHWPGFDNEVRVTLLPFRRGNRSEGQTDSFSPINTRSPGSGGLMWTRQLISREGKDFWTKSLSRR